MKKRILVEELRYQAAHYPGWAKLLLPAADRIEALEMLDQQAAEYVEAVICLRTGFTGEPPYVGWKGLGLALIEALDERDRLRATVQPNEGRT